MVRLLHSFVFWSAIAGYAVLVPHVLVRDYSSRARVNAIFGGLIYVLLVSFALLHVPMP